MLTALDVPIELAEKLAKRSGAGISGQQFASIVSAAFVEVQARPVAHRHAVLRACRSHFDLQALLEQARARLDAGSLVLGVGVGRGWAARDSALTATFCRSTFSASHYDIKRLDLTPELLTGGVRQLSGELVVTHSLLHYFFDPGSVLTHIRALVKPGGMYLMAHEPNSRFMRASVCLGAARDYEAFLRRQPVRRFAPGRIVRWLRSRLMPAPSLAEAVNRRVHRDTGWNADLTFAEISALVDPHFPPASPGMNWDDLGHLLGREFQLTHLLTSGHLGRSTPLRLPSEWRLVEEELRRRYPLDGSTFAALWRRVP